MTYTIDDAIAEIDWNKPKPEPIDAMYQAAKRVEETKELINWIGKMADGMVGAYTLAQHTIATNQSKHDRELAQKLLKMCKMDEFCDKLLKLCDPRVTNLLMFNALKERELEKIKNGT